VTDARSTLRHAGLLIVQHGFHVIGAALFAVLVPRLMGPVAFGQYALMMSISMWFALVSGLGATAMMTRAAPVFVSREDHEGLAKLVTNLVTVRALTGLLAAAAYVAITAGLFGDLEPVAVAFMAGSVWSRAIANPYYALFLGLGRAARWGLGDLLRRWLILVFVIAGFWLQGLRGACAGVLAANIVALIVAIWLGRSYIRWQEIRLDLVYLRPFLRTGASFAAGNLLVALVQRSGETLVRVTTDDYAQVGFYGVTYSVYLTAANALWQGTIAFAPMLMRLHHQGNARLVRAWQERLMTVGAMGAGAGLLGVLFFGDAIVLAVLGPEYRPVADSLIPITLALAALSIGAVGRVAALVADRPGVSATAAAIELAVFWAIGFWLIPRQGSLGGAVAVLFASIAYAVFITLRMRRALPCSAASGVSAIGLAVVFAPLAWIPLGWPTRIALLLGCLAAYAWVLFYFKVITREDWALVRREARAYPPK
jgi:O-antigen/teichoic acid export membrane protein